MEMGILGLKGKYIYAMYTTGVGEFLIMKKDNKS